MGTALIYLVVLLVVAAVFFAGASVVFGRGEELAPVPRGATPTWLPDRGVHASHVRQVRFQQAVRGYKMAEVDWVLDRLAGELDRHTTESDSLRRRIAELESAVAGAKQADVAHLVSGGTQAHPRANGSVHAPGVAQVHGEPGRPGGDPVQRDSGGAHEEAAPGDAAPGEAAPGEAAPGEAAPGEAGPGEAGPGEAAPGEAGPGEAGAPLGEARSGEARSGEAGAPPGEARAGGTRGRQRGVEEPG